MTRVMVTGGAGFIGSNLIRHLLENEPEVEIVNLDKLTYAGNLENLKGVESDGRYTFINADICDAERVNDAMVGVEVVFHLAAESHVDRSIESAAPFVRTNVIGTQVLLDSAREAHVQRFIHVSTDEVYGELPWVDPHASDPLAVGLFRSRFTEDTPLDPRSPYSASKAGGDLLVLSYYRTHDLDVVVARSSNTYGPLQFPEKLIPLMITNALEGQPLPVYGDGLHVRDWLHVKDHCRALVAAWHSGSAGEVYNFGGGEERTNLHVVRGILEALGAGEELIDFVPDRPGHDRRYALDCSKSHDALGWWPDEHFDEALEATVRWYADNEEWWRRIRSGEYREYYQHVYGPDGLHHLTGD